jgi:predicted PurR-regulated permease PerM
MDTQGIDSSGPPDPTPVQRAVYVQPLTPGRVMVLTLSVLFVIGVVWFVIQVRHIVLLLILGILIGTAIEPIVNALRRRGVARGPVILAIYLVLLGTIGTLMLIAIPSLIDQGQALLAGAPAYLDDLQYRIDNSPSVLVRTYGAEIIESAIRASNRIRDNPPLQATQIAQAAEFVGSFFSLLFAVVSILIVTFYWMTEKATIKRFLLSLIPIERRDRAHDMWDEIESKAGGWARGQVILMLAIGVVSTIAYSPLLFDLNFWLFLGIWAGLMELIPFIGPWLGGGLAVLVALTDSWQKAALVIVFVVVINQAEASILVPRVMRNAVGLSPLSVILAVLVGGGILGPLGAILAIPVAAVVQVLVTGLLRARDEDAAAESLAASRSRAPTELPPAAAPPTTVEQVAQEAQG